jgi:hypothetical protein
VHRPNCNWIENTLAALILVILAYLGYRGFVASPKPSKAEPTIEQWTVDDLRVGPVSEDGYTPYPVTCHRPDGPSTLRITPVEGQPDTWRVDFGGGVAWLRSSDLIYVEAR